MSRRGASAPGPRGSVLEGVLVGEAVPLGSLELLVLALVLREVLPGLLERQEELIVFPPLPLVEFEAVFLDI